MKKSDDSQICLDTKIQHYTFSYDNKNKVLDDMEIIIRGGEIVCINGVNGAGKTTLLKILSGLLDEYNTDENIKKIRKESIFISNAPIMYDNLTGMENAKLLCDLWKKNHDIFDRNFQIYLKVFEMENYLDKEWSEYSLGMKYKTFLAAVLSLEIPILLMDEQLNAMDAKSQKKAIKILKEYVADKKHTIIFSSHINNISSELSDRSYILKGGKLYEEE